MGKSDKTVLRQIMDGELAMEQIRENQDLRREMVTELRESVREAVARIRQKDKAQDPKGTGEGSESKNKRDRKPSAES